MDMIVTYFQIDHIYVWLSSILSRVKDVLHVLLTTFESIQAVINSSLLIQSFHPNY